MANSLKEEKPQATKAFHCYACRSVTLKTTTKSAKFETIKAFLSATHEQAKGFLSKCTVLKVRFVTEPSNVLFAGMNMCTIFSPEISQSVPAKGLIYALSDEQTQI